MRGSTITTTGTAAGKQLEYGVDEMNAHAVAVARTVGGKRKTKRKKITKSMCVAMPENEENSERKIRS